MNINYWWFLAGMVILGLASVALYYQYLLFRHKKRQEASNREFQKEIAKRRERGVKSILLISRAVLADQVSLTEASIRINALSILLMNKRLIEELSVFRQLAEATSHIPILEEWKKLSKKQQRDYETERLKIEENFRDFVLAAANKIVHEDLLANADDSSVDSAESAGEVVKQFKP